MHSKYFRSDNHWEGINITNVILNRLKYRNRKHFTITESEVWEEHVLTKPKLWKKEENEIKNQRIKSELKNVVIQHNQFNYNNIKLNWKEYHINNIWTVSLTHTHTVIVIVILSSKERKRKKPYPSISV